MIPLAGVESASGDEELWNAQTIITSMLSGPRSDATFMSLGLMPYINASILISICVMVRSSEAKGRISRQRMNRWTGVLTFFIAFVYAVNKTRGMEFTWEGIPWQAARAIVILEMLLGMVIMYLEIELNKKFGIGGTAPLILVNVCRSVAAMAQTADIIGNSVIVTYDLFVIVVVVIMENYIVKIPLQRVSIHNIYADTNYLGFKLNPIGVLPIMFSTAVFMLCKAGVNALAALMPDNGTVLHLQANFDMLNPLGAQVYVAIIVILAIGFSYTILSPTDVARGLMRSGDSIVNIPAGKRTRRYLRQRLFLLSVNSGVVQGACMWISLWLAISGRVPQTVAMMPMNLMLITNFLITILQEIHSYRRYDAYKFFM